MSRRASDQGLLKIDRARQQRGWTRKDVRWQQAAGDVSEGTLGRFLRGVPIREDSFNAICRAVGVDPEAVAVLPDALTIPGAQLDPFSLHQWVGRKTLLNDLSLILRDRCRLLTIAGITGIGKTTLARQIALKLEAHYPETVVLSFDVQEQTDFASLALFLLERWQQAIPAEAAKEPKYLISLLLNQLENQPHLLILDSLEMLLEGEKNTGENAFQDSLWITFLEKLLALQTCQSRIIITSQDLPTELLRAEVRYSNCCICQLKGLDAHEQLQLFQVYGVDVTDRQHHSREATDILRKIGKAYEGHPLALRVITGEIVNTYGGSVMAYWQRHRSEIETLENLLKSDIVASESDQIRLDRYTQTLKTIVRFYIDKALHRLRADMPDAYIMLCLGSVYRKSVAETFWLSLLETQGFSTEQSMAALDALLNRYFLEIETNPHNPEQILRQHNLIRSTALDHLRRLRHR
jgi:hypothetical protein